MNRRVIVSADDFGLSESVNEAVEQAHRQGVLSSASLMVAGPAAADAIRRAKANPGLRVGLHLVVIEGPGVLPAMQIDRLVGPDGRFPSDQARLGLRYFAHRNTRRQLWREIQAQFASFAATGLRLDHANAHKHMHLHPTVGAMLLQAGRAHGLPAIRIPAEPPAVLRRCGHRPSIGDRALYRWAGLLRAQARRAGVRTNDQAFGIAWSGHMTHDRLARLIPHLPPGLSELYFHPATHQDAELARWMPGYEHVAELRALLHPDLPGRLADAGIRQVTWDA